MLSRNWHRIERKMNGLWASGKFAKLEAWAERLTRNHPQDEAAWVLRSRFAELPEAREALTREGLTFHPDSIYLMHLLSVLLRYSDTPNAYDERRMLADKMVDEHPDLPHGYLVQLELAMIGQRADIARQLVPEIERRLTDEPWVRLPFARFLSSIPEQQGRALQLLEEFEEYYPKTDEGHLLLGLLVERTDPERARRELATAWSVSGLDIETFESWVSRMRDAIRNPWIPPPQGDESTASPAAPA